MTHAIRPNLLFALSRHATLDINIQQAPEGGGWQVTAGAGEQTSSATHADPTDALWLALVGIAPE